MKASKILLACLKRADDKFHLVDDDDKIVVGVSLGKDSMSLLYALKTFQFYSSKKYKIQPIFVDFGFNKPDLKNVKSFCDKIGCSLEIIESNNVFNILKKNQKNNLLPCSICSRMRKAVLCKYAKEHGFNKIALGHHLDDYLATLLMNMKNSNIVDTFSPKMFLDKTKITCIRPLILTKESVIKQYVLEENIPVCKSTCPNSNKTERFEVTKMLSTLEKNYPEINDNFLNSMANLNSLPNINFVENHIGNNFYFKKLSNNEEISKCLMFAKKEKIKLDYDCLSKGFINSIYLNRNLIGIFSFETNEKQVLIHEFHITKKYKKFINQFFDNLFEYFYEHIKPLKMSISIKSMQKKFFEKKTLLSKINL